jgi:hypothetical protein
MTKSTDKRRMANISADSLSIGPIEVKAENIAAVINYLSDIGIELSEGQTFVLKSALGNYVEAKQLQDRPLHASELKDHISRLYRMCEELKSLLWHFDCFPYNDVLYGDDEDAEKMRDRAMIIADYFQERAINAIQETDYAKDVEKKKPEKQLIKNLKKIYFNVTGLNPEANTGFNNEIPEGTGDFFKICRFAFSAMGHPYLGESGLYSLIKKQTPI